MSRRHAHPLRVLLAASLGLVAGMAGDVEAAGALVHALALVVVVAALVVIAIVAPGVATDRMRDRRDPGR